MAVDPISFEGLPFRKMHGLGNDFVVLDGRSQHLAFTQSQLARISDRRFGIGCDQLIVLEASTQADARMRIFNPDGGEVQACGNATRCIGALIADEAGRAEARIETMAGVLFARREGHDIAVDMGLPELGWVQIPLAGAGGGTDRIPLDLSALAPELPGWFSAVNMGNPHAVFFVANAGAIDLQQIGAAIEVHPLFPQKVNVSFAQVIDKSRITLRVWERGAGATLACGTAACATAVAGQRLGFVGEIVRLDLPGGSLTIRRSPEGHVIMIGPTAETYSGVMTPGLFAGVA
ncbi:DapF Diaminopimelate epimerase [Rhabdaerophilaceae bacterium]